MFSGLEEALDLRPVFLDYEFCPQMTAACQKLECDARIGSEAFY